MLCLVFEILVRENIGKGSFALELLVFVKGGERRLI